MLMPTEVKPFLLHEDKLIREASANYFEHGCEHDPELLALVFEGCRRFGIEENSWPLICAQQFRVTESTIPELLALLSQASSRESAERLNRVLENMPVEVLPTFEAEIRDTPGVRADTLSRLERRLDLAAWSSDRLWQELQDYSDRAPALSSTDEYEHQYAQDLVSTLAARDVPDETTILQRLAAFTADRDEWLETYLIDLAGARRLRGTIPLLVDRFHIDADILLERCMYALGRIGDPEAVRLIQRAFPTASWDYKISAQNVLGYIKDPASEQALLDLLVTETDLSIRTYLCLDLCNLFSARGVEVVRRQVLDGYDTDVDRLEEELLLVTDVLDIVLPEAAHWRSKRAKRRALSAKRMAQFDEVFGLLDSLQPTWQDDEEEPSTANTRLEPRDAVLDEWDDSGETIRITGRRVGRNDPCTCGSGKKYKKCCGATKK